MKKLPLQNTETRNIPIAPKLKKELQKDILKHTGKPIPAGRTSGSANSSSCTEQGPCVLTHPLPYTSKKILKLIESTEQQDPNITDLLNEKLASPSTAKYISKKKVSNLTVGTSKNVFKEMISLDVSGHNLAKDLEAERQRRAFAVRPPSRPADPQPSWEDYADLFVEPQIPHNRLVGPSNIFDELPLPVSKTGFVSDSKVLIQFNDIILN